MSIQETESPVRAAADAARVFHASDFGYPAHQPRWLLDGGVRVCGVCGRLSAGVYWGLAPGQPRLAADDEAGYRREQQS